MAFKGMGQIDKKEIWTIPNIITYFRILCVPAYILLMAFAGVNSDTTLLYIAFAVFIIAAASDLVDGWIARKFNMTSGIGMALDPFADKLMHISVLFCLSLCTGLTPLGANTAAYSGGWYVHYAFVILLLLKEAIMICVAPLVMKKGAKVQANWMGKVASFTVSVGVILAFFHPYIYYADWGILAWGICLSYAAAISYLIDIIRQIKKINRGEMQAATADNVKTTDSSNNPLGESEGEDMLGLGAFTAGAHGESGAEHTAGKSAKTEGADKKADGEEVKAFGADVQSAGENAESTGAVAGEAKQDGERESDGTEYAHSCEIFEDDNPGKTEE